jgi:hypothetical protein
MGARKVWWAMDDLERRLRAAMTGASEPPPPGLLAGVRRRHARHVRRVGAGCVAVVAVIAAAIPSVEHALTPGRGPVTPVLPAVGSAPAPGPTAAAGTGLRDCQSNNNGQVSSGWRAQSVHAGPVWFIFARSRGAWPAGHRLADGQLTGGGAVIAIQNGSSAVIWVAPSARAHFRFLTSFKSQDRYTLRDGWAGLTVVGCPAGPVGTGIPAAYAPGLTMFWEGYVSDATRCLPLEVRRLPAGKPVRVTLSGGGTCRAGNPGGAYR